MDLFRRNEKLKTAAKIDVVSSILDDIETMDLSKSSIIALLKGYKQGSEAALKFYDDKINETANPNASN